MHTSRPSRDGDNTIYGRKLARHSNVLFTTFACVSNRLNWQDPLSPRERSAEISLFVAIFCWVVGNTDNRFVSLRWMIRLITDIRSPAPCTLRATHPDVQSLFGCIPASLSAPQSRTAPMDARQAGRTKTMRRTTERWRLRLVFESQ